MSSDILTEVFRIIEQRRDQQPSGSYVASLMSQGIDAIALKVEEETREFIQAVKAEPPPNIVHEAADVFFHAMILLAARKIPIETVYSELTKRRR